VPAATADAPIVRRHFAVMTLVALVVVPSAAAATNPIAERKRDVRAAVVAAETYYAEHGSYAGMTRTRLRRTYDRSLRNVLVRNVTRHRYCIGSTLRPFVHYDGPAGPVRRGPCAS
jgi:hypothetical protein